MDGPVERLERRTALRRVLPSYAVGSLLALVLAAVGAILGYLIGNHSPLGVFAGAAIGLIVAGAIVTGYLTLIRRRPPIPDDALVDGVLGQGRRTGQRDPDAT
jgi:Mg/Co/Ni transporter MgtE